MNLDHINITHPAGHPWAILAHRMGAHPGIVELHSCLEGSHADWKPQLAAMRASGDFTWARWVTLGFVDEEAGGEVEVKDGFEPTPYEEWRAVRHRAGEPFYMPF
jgi:hypothetical protein